MEKWFYKAKVFYWDELEEINHYGFLLISAENYGDAALKAAKYFGEDAVIHMELEAIDANNDVLPIDYMMKEIEGLIVNQKGYNKEAGLF